MKWIKKPTMNQNSITICQCKTRPRFSFIFGIFPFISFEQVPVREITSPGLLKINPGILKSDKELKLGEKFDFEEDNYIYSGVIPINYDYDNEAYECVVDYIESK